MSLLQQRDMDRLTDFAQLTMLTVKKQELDLRPEVLPLNAAASLYVKD